MPKFLIAVQLKFSLLLHFFVDWTCFSVLITDNLVLLRLVSIFFVIYELTIILHSRCVAIKYPKLFSYEDYAIPVPQLLLRLTCVLSYYELIQVIVLQ